MKQVAFEFDSVTMQKIYKGFLIALTGGIAIGALTFAQEYDFGVAVINTVVATIVPVAVNSVREWMKGVE